MIEISVHKKPILSIPSFSISKGKVTFLFGESGIGKSLLSKYVMDLLDLELLQVKATEGLSSEERENGFYVFQEPSSYFNPLQTIDEQLNESDLSSRKENESIYNALWEDNTWMELGHIYPKDYRPSGGEKQRLYAFMALKKMKQEESGFFVFDEPTGNLDEYHRNKMLDSLIGSFKKGKQTVLIITHDYTIIDYIVLNFPKLKSFIEYNELVKTSSELELKPFETSSYISFLKAGNYDFSKSLETDTLFQLNHSIGLFGKQLTIYQNEKPTDLKLGSGSISYLKARSGAGKTSIAKMICGLLDAEHFSFRLNDKRYTEHTPKSEWNRTLWGKKIGLVFQHADRALNPNSTVWEVFKHLPIESMTKTTLLSYLSNVFSHVDEVFLNKKTSELSGGQKQRINLLRTFALNTDIVILDEPFTGLDIKTMNTVLKMISDKLQEGTAFLLISHNESFFDRLIPEKNVFHIKSRIGE